MDHTDSYLTADQADEYIAHGETCYIVFEDDSPKPKMYDLSHGIFTDLAEAKRRVGKNDGKERLHIADYAAYIKGSYDYLEDTPEEETEREEL